MAKKGVTARDVISLLAGMMFGGPVGSPASMLGGAGGGLGSLLAGKGAGVSDGYPSEYAPDAYHYHNVIYAPRPDGIKGPYQNMNYMGKADAATIAEAAEQQSLEEHEEALTKYVRMLPPNATPKQIQQALERGRDEEKELPKWWNESNNRREFSVSSSAVSGIRITPEGNVEVKWGKSPTWYTFKKYGNTRDASIAARKLLQSDSIGRAVYPVVSRPPKKPNPLLGEWNAANYEGAYAQ